MTRGFSRLSVLFTLSAAAATGCILGPFSEGVAESSRDGGSFDASPPRGGSDASRADAQDAGAAGAEDAGAGDQDAGDSGVGNEGAGDSGAADQGARDSGTPDQGARDASVPGDQDAGAIPEVCDGIDNDGNGIIDDVDVAGDGVCDCLKVATLGYPGQWGSDDVFGAWLASRGRPAVSLGATVLTDEVLAPFHVVAVEDVRDGIPGVQGVSKGIGRVYSDEEVQVLRRWVEAGGGLVTLTGYADITELKNVNRLLAPFGLKYDPVPILLTLGTLPIQNWAANPIADGVRAVGFNFGYPVEGGTRVAWHPNAGQWDVGRVTEQCQGHVFAWGDEWVSYVSDWQGRSDYQVGRFWVNILKWLTAAGKCKVPTP